MLCSQKRDFYEANDEQILIINHVKLNLNNKEQKNIFLISITNKNIKKMNY